MFHACEVVLATGLLLLLWSACAWAQPTVWVVDPLVKVFRTDEPPDEPAGVVSLRAAAGEYESAQVCVRSRQPLENLQVVLPDLVGPAGTISASALTWNPVGYVPLTHGTPDTPAAELCCQPPVDVPDPLLPTGPLSLAADRTQPLWLTVAVPREAAPGDYSGILRVTWDGGEAPVELRLTVWPFVLPADQHLTFTNWISPDALARHHGLEVYSDAFFEMLGRYARAAAEHHQNVLWIGLEVVGISQGPEGGLTFDWSIFDRWVEVVTANGCGRLIEIRPLGYWDGGWDNPRIALGGYSVRGADGQTTTRSAEEVLPELLPALQAHLQERGWLERTVIHIADEPAVHHAADWREKARWVRSLAPGLRRIDAIEAPYFGDDLEIWVPKLNHLYNWLPRYEAARQRGAEIWFYTCCHPTGVFPNRFLDQPLLKTRILQWYNWRYNLSGYLHWGFISWDDNPLASCGPGIVPPGDCWIVYPGPDGPLSSLRWEALRDGFEDYELLWLLAERTRQVAQELGVPPEAFNPRQPADELARQLVRTMIDYARTPDELRRVREAAAEQIMQLEAPPRAIVTTDPPLDHLLAAGPIVVHTRVWAQEGAAVQVNGQPTRRQPDGCWAQHTFVSPTTGEVRVEIAQGMGSKTVVRRYRVETGQ